MWVLLVVGGILTWAFWKRNRGDEIRLTEKDNGTTVTVKPGSTIVVILTANPSTGFGWYPATTKYPLGQPEVRLISTGPIIPGASRIETRTYRITPAMIGSHRVQLEYKRAFDPVYAGVPTASDKIFLFNAVVNP